MTTVVFKKVDYTLSGLLENIVLGNIGLPDIQRPFIWKPVKVRDLFDSMYKGFPVGYFLFWSNDQLKTAKAIGTEVKQKVPALLIIDGQQRLTSLYSVIKDKKVLDSDYKEYKIGIAFHPLDETFEVTDAAIANDDEWISDLSTVWGNEGMHAFVTDYLEKLRAYRTKHNRELTKDEEKKAAANIDKVHDLVNYPFTALEISETVDEEQVADIFVRINSEGVKLNQADFILTLMSVFSEDGRIALEKACRESRSPGTRYYNHFIRPDPDQLLRVAVAVGFQRARLKATYNVLRGKDLETGQFSPELRDLQFQRLAEAQSRVLNSNDWHGYFHALTASGFKGAELISSKNTLIYCYAFYLIGRTQFSVDKFDLDKLIARFFWAASLTNRYTGSFETIMEQDLARLRELTKPDEFVTALSRVIDDTLTHDYWTIQLPNALESSSTRSPVVNAYYAAQIKLGAPVLFSQKLVSDLFTQDAKPTKKPLDRHHLFPRAYLEKNGLRDLKRINTAANLAYLEFVDNIGISDTSPADYVPKMRARFKDGEYAAMCEINALPDNWELMTYDEFLGHRRGLMAKIIRKGFDALE